VSNTLNDRIGSKRPLPLGEQVLLAVSLAAGDVGALVERVLREHGLTHTRYNVLRILRGAGSKGLPAKEIGRRLLVPSPDVTRLVDPLVASDLAERSPNPSDRRVLQHRLTHDGTALLARLDDELAHVYVRIERVLGPRDSRSLIGLCERLITTVGVDP